MKQKLILGLMALSLMPAALSQTPGSYENWGVVQCPPEIPPTIDATNFVNHAQFTINFTNEVFLPVTIPPYYTSDTVNYTNDFGAVMSCNTGFLLETLLQSGQEQRAGTLYNNGTINCGTVGTSNTFIVNTPFSSGVLGSGVGVSCRTDATNIVNPGTINMGYESLLTLQGENVDLTHGTLAMENVGFNGNGLGAFFFNGGFFDGYWGLSFISTNYNFLLDPTMFEASPPYSQYFLVTNRAYQVLYPVELGGPTFVPYLLDVTDSSGSNRTVRAVFLSNTNPAVTANVYLQTYYPYDMDPDYVGFTSIITNAQGVTTNFFYIQDSYLYYTNHQLYIDGYAGVGFNRPTFVPANYSFYTGGQVNLGTPAVPTTIPIGTFIPGTVTNQWTAYQAMFLPGSAVPGDVAGQNVTNEPGRIELTADKYLTLPQAQISSVNYLLLKGTNHFESSSGAQIAAPYADLYLRSTNGLLTITNVLMPYLPRPIGICNLYSARWTNIVAGVTNRFHVLFVDAQYAPTSPLMVQTLDFAATNAVTHTNDDSIFISDVFNVTSNLLIDTCRLTLTTNAPGSPAPAGTLNYLNPNILWPGATPRLKYLTNNGVIQAQNFVVFGGSQSSPYNSPNTSTNPYAAFVNTGSVTNFGSAIFANYFLNSGTFFASGGAIQLRQAQNSILTNGVFLAPGSAGSIMIQGGSLLASNHVLQAGNALTLSLTNYLDDGSVSAGADAVTNRNVWLAGYGINLPVLPTNGASLLATTITNIGPAGALVYNTWAGQDRGPVVAGYSNNAALGRLILDGLTNTTQFWFQPATGTPATGTNALYVDYLEFRDYMTNFDHSGNLANLKFSSTNMKIYYAQAMINGVSWAEKLNGKNGGGLNWVSAYAGTFSSTNMIYPDRTTNRLNLALVQSCDLDSNGNGIPNCVDPAPVLVPSQYGAYLSLGAAISGKTNVLLSWNNIPTATISLYFKTNVTGTNWQFLTSFAPTNTWARRYTNYPVGPSSRFYRAAAAP